MVQLQIKPSALQQDVDFAEARQRYNRDNGDILVIAHNRDNNQPNLLFFFGKSGQHTLSDRITQKNLTKQSGYKPN